jgi:L-alanine-DL-glutamate epimerase-like enolase superfamily enzyme
MKRTAVETIALQRGITVTDTGLTGLGETYPWPDAEGAIVQKALAPVLIGRDPLPWGMVGDVMYVKSGMRGPVLDRGAHYRACDSTRTMAAAGVAARALKEKAL